MSASPHPLHVGIKMVQQGYPIEVHREVWRTADEGGFDNVWAFDHLMGINKMPESPIFDGWTVVAAMAALTKRIRVGLNVTGNMYRHPALLAKIAVTVDHLSGGRLDFGIGAGWNEPEFTMTGMPYASAGERGRRLDESCAVIRALWTESRANFTGRYYRLTDAIAEPKPVQRPYPPIWVGGSGPTLTLLAAAKHADVWNGQAKTVEALEASSKLLDGHCAAVGRDPAAIRRSAQVTLGADEGEALRSVERHVAAGFTEILLRLDVADPRAVTERAARTLLPRIRTLG